MSKKARIHFGIAWYDSEDSFNNMKTAISDKEIWEDSYEEWLDNAILREEEIKRTGIKPRRVKITPEELIKWCQQENKKPDAAARASYISFLLEKSYSESE